MVSVEFKGADFLSFPGAERVLVTIEEDIRKPSAKFVLVIPELLSSMLILAGLAV